MTVSDFITSYCTHYGLSPDSIKSYRAKFKKILREDILHGGNDTYIASELTNVTWLDIKEFVTNKKQLPA